MCKDARGTAVSLLTAIEPTIKNLLTATGQISTDQGKQIITYYDAALAAIQNWESGSPAQEVIEAIDALQNALPLLPIPTQYSALVSIVLAGIATVIGVLNANSPAASPTSVDAVPAAHLLAAPHEVQALHQATVIADTTDKVKALVPGFKRSIFTSPAHQYKSAWNKQVEENKLPDTLKV